MLPLSLPLSLDCHDGIAKPYSFALAWTIPSYRQSCRFSAMIGAVAMHTCSHGPEKKRCATRRKRACTEGDSMSDLSHLSASALPSSEISTSVSAAPQVSLTRQKK